MTTDSSQNPEPLPGEPSAAPEKPQRPRLTSTPTGQNIFVGLMVLATLGVVALLGGAFVLGNNVAGAATEEPVAVEQAPAEPEISFPTLSGEPLGPGPTDWLELRGGECISPFSGAFDEQFVVVPCAGSHQAQLARTVLLSSDPLEEFPGEAVVAAKAREFCALDSLVNRDLVVEYSDLVVEFAYPVNTQQWDLGQRGVYCFLTSTSRSGFDSPLLY